MVLVQGGLKGFIRMYPKTPAVPLQENILQFPRGKCEKESARGTPGVVVPLRRR